MRAVLPPAVRDQLFNRRGGPIMALTALEDLLRTSMGLNAASIGPAAIARAVHERQAICRLADTHAYLDQGPGVAGGAAGADRGRGRAGDLVLPRSPGFRRDGPHGARGMAHHPCRRRADDSSACRARPAKSRTRWRWRCSTPVCPRTASVSTRSISAAAIWLEPRSRVYGRNSFRGGDLGFRDRHFDKVADGYRVKRARCGSRCGFTRATSLPPTCCRARRSTTWSSAATC